MPCTIEHLGIVALWRSSLLQAKQLWAYRLRTLRNHLIIPVTFASIPFVEQGLVRLPGIEVAREVCLTSIGYIVHTCTNLTIHKERCLVQALVLVLLTKCFKLRDKLLVECQAGDVARCINTETIDTHLDKLSIAIYEILSHVVVLCVEIHTVTSNLPHPTAWEVPVPVVGSMVPIVVYIVVIAICILHQGKTTLILYLYIAQVIVAQLALIRDHTSINVCLVTKMSITVEHLAELLLTEVTSVVEHDVKNDLDTLVVSLVDEFLEHHVTTLAAVTALIAAVNLREIHGMIAVVVITRRILNDRCNPDGCKT